jgi:hypothetical protein
MPYKDKEKQKQRQHELYLQEKQVIRQAREMLGLPVDRRKKTKTN